MELLRRQQERMAEAPWRQASRMRKMGQVTLPMVVGLARDDRSAVFSRLLLEAQAAVPVGIAMLV